VANNSGHFLRKGETFAPRKVSNCYAARGVLNPTRSCLVRSAAQPRTQAATENQHIKMHNYCKTIGALAAASALVAGNANAEVEYEMHGGYSSEYVFRGLDLGDDLVEMGVDVAYETNGVSLSGGIWTTAFDSALTTHSGTENEIDLYAAVAKDFGFLTASVGYIYYWNLSSLGADNQEVYVALSRDLGFAKASLTYFGDVDRTSKGDTDGYTELALTRGFELSQCLTLNLKTNVGYLVEGGDFTAWTTKATLDWGFAEHAKFSPFVAVSVALGESAGSAWASTSNELLGGSMVSVSF
jgi:uncharacterized protein (TIGR02001 family)